jgi:hypothetical protein
VDSRLVSTQLERVHSVSGNQNSNCNALPAPSVAQAHGFQMPPAASLQPSAQPLSSLVHLSSSLVLGPPATEAQTGEFQAPRPAQLQSSAHMIVQLPQPLFWQQLSHRFSVTDVLTLSKCVDLPSSREKTLTVKLPEDAGKKCFLQCCNNYTDACSFEVSGQGTSFSFNFLRCRDFRGCLLKNA